MQRNNWIPNLLGLIAAVVASLGGGFLGKNYDLQYAPIMTQTPVCPWIWGYCLFGTVSAFVWSILLFALQNTRHYHVWLSVTTNSACLVISGWILFCELAKRLKKSNNSRKSSTYLLIK